MERWSWKCILSHVERLFTCCDHVQCFSFRIQCWSVICHVFTMFPHFTQSNFGPGCPPEHLQYKMNEVPRHLSEPWKWVFTSLINNHREHQSEAFFTQFSCLLMCLPQEKGDFSLQQFKFRAPHSFKDRLQAANGWSHRERQKLEDAELRTGSVCSSQHGGWMHFCGFLRAKPLQEAEGLFKWCTQNNEQLAPSTLRARSVEPPQS